MFSSDIISSNRENRLQDKSCNYQSKFISSNKIFLNTQNDIIHNETKDLISADTEIRTTELETKLSPCYNSTKEKSTRILESLDITDHCAPCSCVITIENSSFLCSANNAVNESIIKGSVINEINEPVIETISGSTNNTKNTYKSNNKSLSSITTCLIANKLPVKSIFDLDDEELRENNKISELSNQNEAFRKLLDQEQSEDHSIMNVKAEHSLSFPVDVKYTIQEDSFCKAKLYYESLKEKITDHFIDVLHNSYLTNINGNWSDETSMVKDSNEKDPFHNLNMVPKFDHINNERLMKELSEINMIYLKKKHYFCEDNLSNVTKKQSFHATSNIVEQQDPIENLSLVDNAVPLKSTTKESEKFQNICKKKVPIELLMSNDKDDLKMPIRTMPAFETLKSEIMNEEECSEKHNYIFKEWHEVVNLKRNGNDSLLVLPYVIID